LDEIGWIEAALVQGVPDDLAEASKEQRARWLMAQLLYYHRREEKPVWWAYFNRLEMSPEELVEDSEAIGELTEDPTEPPLADKRSFIYTLRFGEQEHKLAAGAEIRDVETERGVDVVEIDDAKGVVRIRRGQNRADEPLPAGLIPGGPYRTMEQRAALRRLGTEIAAAGVDGPGEFRALRDVLRRCPPRISGRAQGMPLQDGSPHVDDLKRLAEGLDSSCLFIQGPPGSGKTWTGAQLIVHLIGAGRRVGVAATSHKAIHNLLHEVETAAHEQDVDFRGWKKCSNDNPESEFSSKLDHSFIENEPDSHAFPRPKMCGSSPAPPGCTHPSRWMQHWTISS
jgi:hypothetical protein